ncbi:hypothetical protein [Brachyspira alvinipulli]|uniref:hypothetical protein n=1 Tax=Brachyspira alvinipulli TaxID=84379 RepID=UPI000483FD9F|nr:hypothetical protein [Brachyspira alvinipulli]
MKKFIFIFCIISSFIFISCDDDNVEDRIDKATDKIEKSMERAEEKMEKASEQAEEKIDNLFD